MDDSVDLIKGVITNPQRMVHTYMPTTTRLNSLIFWDLK